MSSGDAHCPHCRRLLLSDAPYPYPMRPERCEGCGLLVGPGRALEATGAVRRPLRSSRPIARRTSTPASAPEIDLVQQILRESHRGPEVASIALPYDGGDEG